MAKYRFINKIKFLILFSASLFQAALCFADIYIDVWNDYSEPITMTTEATGCWQGEGGTFVIQPRRRLSETNSIYTYMPAWHCSSGHRKIIITHSNQTISCYIYDNGDWFSMSPGCTMTLSSQWITNDPEHPSPYWYLLIYTPSDDEAKFDKQKS